MDKNIEDLQDKLKKFGMLSVESEEVLKPVDKIDNKYIYSDDKNVLVISSMKQEFFSISNDGEFFVNGKKINAEKEFIKTFSIVIEQLLGETHGSMMKRVRREARQDVINDLEDLSKKDFVADDIIRLINKWK